MSRITLLLLLMLGSLGLVGCGAEELLLDATPVPGAAATAARAAATAIPTPLPIATRVAPPPSPARLAAPSPVSSPVPPAQALAEVEAVVARMERALQEDQLAELEPLMLEQVAIAVPQSVSQILPRQEVLSWLMERMDGEVRVASWREVEHYGLLEIVSEGWARRPPIQAGKVTFNLHRFDSQGRQDALRGTWRIDVLIPE